MSYIHPSSIVESGAKIGKNVRVGPFCLIGKHVILEDNVEVKSHVCIDGHTSIGQNTKVWSHAILGTKTQDLKFKGEKTEVIIGKNCEIRECVTINSSSGENTAVRVGDNCYIMAYCHIAHNCELGNRVIMANNATLAGHVIIEDCAVIGGLSAIHQFSRIGCFAMVGGMSRITQDVLPYSIGAGSPYKVGGLNLIGLKRHGFDFDVRKELTRAFKYLYRMRLPLDVALEHIQNELNPITEIRHLVTFCKQTKRGLIGMRGSRASQAVLAGSWEETEEIEVQVFS